MEKRKTTIKAVRKYHFCSGHRLMGHESKCANLHGHNYSAFFHAEAEILDDVGRVVDFAVLKEKIGAWIDKHWDHTMILYKEDKATINALEQCEKNKPIFLLDQNPTAENMANYLIQTVCPQVLKGTGVKVTKIVLWETENCFVEVWV